MAADRFLWAVLFAGVPAAVAVVASPPHPYARAILGAAAFLAGLPLAYLLAGSRAVRGVR